MSSGDQLSNDSVLPWKNGQPPLMLAPMQGLTNSALRRLFLQKYQPDLVFTEFVRVQTRTRKRVARNELTDLQDHHAEAPLVVQLIGNDPAALAEAAILLQAQGIQHINLNLGCPYGRMTTGATGGELLRQPQQVASMLTALRRVCQGSFSVKSRAGYDDLNQWQNLLPLFEDSGVDFIVLHPRTVAQRYSGEADHRITAAMAKNTSLPIIANGDIRSAQEARTLLVQTGVAGLMIGRGALSDPFIFQRIRGAEPLTVGSVPRRQELGQFIGALWPSYLQKFSGERQALMKIKDVLNFIPDPDLQRDLGRLKRATSSVAFLARLEDYFPAVQVPAPF